MKMKERHLKLAELHTALAAGSDLLVNTDNGVYTTKVAPTVGDDNLDMYEVNEGRMKIEICDEQLDAIIIHELKAMMDVYENYLKSIEKGIAVHCFAFGEDPETMQFDAELIREKLYSYSQVLDDHQA